MYGAGKLFPRGDKSPAIVPVPGDDPAPLAAKAAGSNRPYLALGRSVRIASGFYISQTQEVVKSPGFRTSRQAQRHACLVRR